MKLKNGQLFLITDTTVESVWHMKALDDFDILARCEEWNNAVIEYEDYEPPEDEDSESELPEFPGTFAEWLDNEGCAEVAPIANFVIPDDF